MELFGKRALVVGLAKTGLAAARFLDGQGARVTVNDIKPADALAESRRELAGLNIETVLGSHPVELFRGAELIVVSPGVPRFLPALVEAGRAGVEIVSEMELAARFVSAPLLAVGGTNGKTTVTALLGEMAAAEWGSENVFVGGNIGTPLTELVLSGRKVQAAVVEVSSFQMEFVEQFRPRVGIMLNVTDDHLDRYRDFEDYAATKARLFARQGAEDFAVLNADDPPAAAMAGATRGQAVWFGLEKPRRPGCRIEGKSLVWEDAKGGRREFSLQQWKPVGVHNRLNVMAAAAAATAFGISAAAVQKTLDSFRGLHHRLEWAGEKDGVAYYNDSKATNRGAVAMAVRSFAQPVILLAGGQAKGCHFQSLRPELKGRVKLVVTYGESRGQLKEELSQPGAYQVETVETLAEAVGAARRAARPGDVVLLSPACASFDQFRDYQDRGERFVRLVEAMR